MDKAALGQGFFQNSLVFRCLCHSTSAPYSPPSACCSYKKDKPLKSGNLPKSYARSEIGEHCIEKRKMNGGFFLGGGVNVHFRTSVFHLPAD